MLGTSLHHTSESSTNAVPPYRPLAPSYSSSEEGEGDMDQVEMMRRERDRRLKLGRGDDEDAEEGQGGQGDGVRERMVPHPLDLALSSPLFAVNRFTPQRIWVADDAGSGRYIRLWVVKC
ncbi:hypothetical protein DFH09DRAFT_1323663 [Mycena vulgaris]|nr:hypothetical protein DFH09DRAFT_1323663 [Mycena vulgaris]